MVWTSGSRGWTSFDNKTNERETPKLHEFFCFWICGDKITLKMYIVVDDLSMFLVDFLIVMIFFINRCILLLLPWWQQYRICELSYSCVLPISVGEAYVMACSADQNTTQKCSSQSRDTNFVNCLGQRVIETRYKNSYNYIIRLNG